MEKNNKNTTKKYSGNQDPAVHDDQLGENASGEFKSEEYDNVLTNKNKNKGVK